MTGLKQRLIALIDATGPISVADYFSFCLFDPAGGYYTTREPFGVAGDFVTAPEISQMFGELVGVWICLAWAAVGRPAGPVLAEIGPGRGTLMKDMLRTIDRLEPGLARSACVVLVETSARLTAVQRATLAPCGHAVEWVEDLGGLPDGPLFLVGNEIFDAIPVRQFVKMRDGWRERLVGHDGSGELSFVAGASQLEPDLLPPQAATAPEGAIVEIAPARSALMQIVAERLAGRGGCALFIDYGHFEKAIGDTLQAVRRHAADPVLANPGAADLTAHVDFQALADVARAAGLAVHRTTQGDFLCGLGLMERAGRLGMNAGDERRAAIEAAVERLAGPEAMGSLFKVLALSPGGVAIPPFGPFTASVQNLPQT